MKSLFFFGSGADSNYCDRLKSGQSFVSALLLGNYSAEAELLNGEDFKHYRLIYNSSTKVFLKTILSYPDEARKVIDGSIVDTCLNYAMKNNDVTFSNIKSYCSEWYKSVMDKTNSTKVRDFFLKHAVFFDSLDEKFNSLRLNKLDDSAKRVIDAYTQVFILMLKSVYDLENDFPWNYDAVFQKLNEPYDITNESNKSSYYCTLKNSSLKSKIVTTNYTSLAEDETGRLTIYLHGKLTWFEDLRNLTVLDCTNSRDLIRLGKSKRIIPFILIPSGVKPLICPKQIKEFSSFIEELSKTDTLVVVGYKFNSEDNHINSIIAEWLRDTDGKMIYLNFNNDVNFSDLDWASEFKISKLKAGDIESINKISKFQIISITTDSQSCDYDFKRLIAILEEKM